jgi:anion transporter
MSTATQGQLATTAETDATQSISTTLELGSTFRLIAGPLVALAFCFLPLGMEPLPQRAIAVGIFMIFYWILEPIDHGITALIGCYLFWALGVVKFSVAFGGFTSTTPWFMFGAFLIGAASSRTGLAKRIGYTILQRTGMRYSQLLLGIIVLSFLLNFLIPNGTARVAVIGPIIIGLVAAFGLDNRSNLARGLFLILCYTSSLFDKMIMSGQSAFLTRGIVEEIAGAEIFWGQWFFAYLPATLATIAAGWVLIRWLFPVNSSDLPDGARYISEALADMGAWTVDEKKTLAWTLLAMAIWATDFYHRTNPAIVGIGVGLLLALPKIGVLNSKDVKQVNFLVIAFTAGAITLGNVMSHTQALGGITAALIEHATPLLASGFVASLTLYWSEVIYSIFLANNQSNISTALPLLLELAKTNGYNPVALGLIWTFASGANIFVYQSSVLVLGYSFGYFNSKDLFKLGALLTLVECALLTILVSYYWPLIGLHWMK